MVDDEDRLAAERALGGSLAKSVAAMDKKGVRGLKGALAQAAGKFRPGPVGAADPGPQLRRHDGSHARRSVPDWTMIPGPKAPDDAPNVLILLIDDAGFGATDTYTRSGCRKARTASSTTSPTTSPTRPLSG